MPSGSQIVDDIFGFLSNTDILVVLDSSLLDREDIPEYQFEVVATDTGGPLVHCHCDHHSD